MKKLLGLALVLATLSVPLFAANPKPVTLTLWTHEDPNRQKLEEQFAAEYMAKNPHVTIKYSVFPSTKIQDLISSAYAAKNAPSIWNLELQKAYPLFSEGLVAPIPVQEYGMGTSLPAAASISATATILFPGCPW